MEEKSLLKFTTAIPFPLLVYKVNVRYNEVRKASGVAYILLDVIEKTAGSEDKICDVLLKFGIPRDLHYIFGKEISNLIGTEILSYDYDPSHFMNPKYFSEIRVKDVSLTAKGRKMFREGAIPTGEEKVKTKDIFYSPVAENDLKIYSENMTWSIRERYKKGWISIGSQIFGYRMNKENNTLIVEPTEAETVKRIYNLYEEGLGQVAISHILEEEKRANIYGEVKWDVGAIRYILTNEKYKGCALTQKGIYVHGIKQKNDNLAPQWYMENTHEAIITPEQFERVQELIKERARKSKRAKPGDYVFARKIECGCCGGGYSHKFNNTNKPWRNEIWICSKQNTYGAGHCTNTRIKDEVLKNLFVECYNEFVRENGNTDELMELRDSQRKLLEQERELNALRVNRMIEISDYNAEIAKVREQITECNKQIALHEMRGARKEDLVEIKEFDDSKVEIFLEKAVVLNHTITFTFINGMSISREYTNGHGGNTAGWLDRRLDRLSKEGKQ